MKEKPQSIAYARAAQTRNQSAPYEQKFAGLIKAIAENKNTGIQNVIITEPWVIGDTYAEVIESLSRLAGSNLALLIVQREINAARN